ncbi:hypothetical protein [Streptomyces sp. NPDC006510]|uniref:hypothetical protein n=1 Tax=Streptomyces sp. NPDC006510 TaxID=3155600 RepID=UPI0033B631E0
MRPNSRAPWTRSRTGPPCWPGSDSSPAARAPSSPTLGLPAREHLHTRLARQRDQFGEHLDQDRAALDTLLDADAPTGILWRPDTFCLTATTVHTTRSRTA